MTTRTVHPDRGLPELGPDLEAAWWQWLARHGLPDPHQIPYRSEIICDDDDRTVTTERWVRHGRGISVDPVTNTGRRETVTVQLEAPALPIPPGFKVTID